MKKNNVRFESIPVYDMDGYINSAIDRLTEIRDNMEQQGFHNIRLSYEHFECGGGDFNFIGDRDETEIERTKRLKRERRIKEVKQAQAEKARQKRLEQYKKLQKEFK